MTHYTNSLIKVYYATVDGYHQRREFRTLTSAQRFAQQRIGQHPDIGQWYAISNDGVGRITVSGTTLAALFPAKE